MPFELIREQFPVIPAFCITINKSQGQTLNRVGIYLPDHCFTHGQLYVAMSRVTDEKNLFLSMHGNITRNIVYKEIFS